MRYLITGKTFEPFLTNWFEPENNYNSDEGMVVYDLANMLYMSNGVDWFPINEDHL